RARKALLSPRSTFLQQSRAPRVEMNADLLLVLEDAVYRLPPEDREAVVRRFYEGADFASIGTSLSISAEAARKRVTRALAAVKSSIVSEGLDAIPDELTDSLDLAPSR